MDLPQKLRRTVELLDACDFSHERVSTKAAKEQMTKAATEIERLEAELDLRTQDALEAGPIIRNLKAQLAEVRTAAQRMLDTRQAYINASDQTRDGKPRDDEGEAADALEQVLATDAGQNEGWAGVPGKWMMPKAAAEVLAAAVEMDDGKYHVTDRFINAVRAYRKDGQKGD